MKKQVLEGLSDKQAQRNIPGLSQKDNRGLNSDQLNKNIKPLKDPKIIKPPKGGK